MRPPEVPQFTPKTTTRPAWIGVVISVLIHGTILSAVIWGEAHPAFALHPQADSVEIAARHARAVSMVFLPPPAPSRLDGRAHQKRPKPDPVPTPPPPEQVAERPPAKGDEGARSAEDNVAALGGASAPTTVPDAIPLPTPPTEPPKRHLPSIAFHGGQPGSELGRTDPSPAWSRPPSLAGTTPQCTPGPARSASDPIDWGVVAGRVYHLGTTEPLAGATLQILGTPYSTISDEHGDYVLRFDAWPLRNCQEEYVRVQLDGFVSQTLNLTIGVNTRSDVQLRGR